MDENVVANQLLVLGSTPPNTDKDTPLAQAYGGPMYYDNNINPYHQVPFVPNQPQTFQKYIGERDKDDKMHTQQRDGLYLFQMKDMYMLYVGGFQHGNPHGKGTLYKNIDGRDIKYIDGMDAVQQMTMSTMCYGREPITHYICRYEGTWDANKPFCLHGKGDYHDKDCHIKGTFATKVVNGEHKFTFEGQVTYTYNTGDVFNGLLYPYDVLIPYRGIYTYNAGHTYRGTFPDHVANNLDHFGTYVDADGHSYSGPFLNDKKHGEGMLCFENGDRFIGQFYDDFPVYGKMETATDTIRSVTYVGHVNHFFKPIKKGCKKTFVYNKLASTYDGYFVAGNKHGEGTETVYNNQFNNTMPGTFVSKGTWKNDAFSYGEQQFVHATNGQLNFTRKGFFAHGEIRKGTYIHANGDEYHGNFDANGQASGEGTLFQEHSVYEGTWKNNERHGLFNSMTRGGVLPTSNEHHYMHCINAIYEKDTCHGVQRYSSSKRKKDFENFKRACRRRINVV